MIRSSLILISLALAGCQSEAGPEFNEEASSAIQEFATTLRGALMQAMQEGGPMEAVEVCNKIAPEIAASLSEQYQFDIGRTSLKVRNPDNQPDDWETLVLKQFETRLAGGEDIAGISFSEVVDSEQGLQWRMMKAIPTEQACLTCHGVSIAEPLQAIIDRYYPEDQATGFSIGQIRGAFTVSRPLGN